MSLKLERLETGDDALEIAEFETDSAAGRVSVSFTVSTARGVAVAAPTPDVFAEFASSIEDLRKVAATVIAFATATAS